MFRPGLLQRGCRNYTIGIPSHTGQDATMPLEQLEFRHGPLRFTALAQGKGPVVLCLHGFPDNARSYRLQLPALAAAGFRAVSLALRGYEPASIPGDGDYTLGAIADDVIAVVDQLAAGQVHLVGHDWGAAVGYTAAALSPEHFLSLTTLAIPHPGRFMAALGQNPRQLALSSYMLFFQLRGIAERVVARNDYDFIRRLWRKWSPGWEFREDDLQDVIRTLQQPGVLKATLGYYRAALDPRALPYTAKARAEALFQVPVPTLAITGERDRCCDTEVFKAAMRAEDFPRGLVVEQVAGAGHFLHQERPEALNAILLDWLETHPQP
jgi:pimeloyl-ACP methyl ester carboxylesterase